MQAVSLIADLKSKIDAVLAPITKELSQLILLDFPNHSNVGDSAIWLGELAYFAAMHGKRPAFVCAKENCSWDILARLVARDPIFLHGGGNFGDLWPNFQNFREAVLDRFPGHPVVQLPQSIHFDDSSALRKTAETIRRHGNFVLLVRDRKSLEIATNSFECPVHLCPDMAFYLQEQPRPCEPTQDLLFLLRNDRERSEGQRKFLPPELERFTVQDWLDEDPSLYRTYRRRTALGSLLRLGDGLPNKVTLRQILYRNLAETRLKRGLTLLSSSRYIISDRLHTHILSLLLGIPHVALDNSYGKVSRYIATWTSDCDIVRTAATIEAGIEIWRREGGAQRTQSFSPIVSGGTRAEMCGASGAN
jgi:exopolysaccharide biosynthesis predicted pyruvyltransferase EpsI